MMGLPHLPNFLFSQHQCNHEHFPLIENFLGLKGTSPLWLESQPSLYPASHLHLILQGMHIPPDHFQVNLRFCTGRSWSKEGS